MNTKRQLFIYGSGRLTPPFLSYMARLTGKTATKLCFIPTASGDDVAYIDSFYDVCSELSVQPHVLRVWISSYNQQETYAELISKMDAIVVGGGNTLNMLAIWKAQGIDLLLKEAYDRGVVMGGGSAGSLCWFNAGTTDSRPKELSIVKGMRFIDQSHCPHYNSEKSRRPLYHRNILEGVLTDGYACDDRAAIHFVNEQVKKAVRLDTDSNSYHVFRRDGKIVEHQLESSLIGNGLNMD